MNLYAPALGRSIYFTLPVYDICKILSFLNKKSQSVLFSSLRLGFF